MKGSTHHGRRKMVAHAARWLRSVLASKAPPLMHARELSDRIRRDIGLPPKC